MIKRKLKYIKENAIPNKTIFVNKFGEQRKFLALLDDGIFVECVEDKLCIVYPLSIIVKHNWRILNELLGSD